MNDLRRQNSRPQQTFDRLTPRTHKSPRELARQSEAKRKQRLKARQMCVDDDNDNDKYNLEKTSLLIAQYT